MSNLEYESTDSACFKVFKHICNVIKENSQFREISIKHNQIMNFSDKKIANAANLAYLFFFFLVALRSPSLILLDLF